MTAWYSSGETAAASGERAVAGTIRLDGISAVVWGPNEDTRLLLRGLLRLYHCPVVHEVEELEQLDALPSLAGPTVLVADTEGRPPEWESELAATVRVRPELRALVVLARGGTASEARARAAGASGVLVRPFSIPDFARAVEATAFSAPWAPARR